MSQSHPIIWIIGATRSSKSYLAKGLSYEGRAGLNLASISTSGFFREGYGIEDSFSKEFVFGLSEFAAASLAQAPDKSMESLIEKIESIPGPCIIEGERNPIQFSKIYDPKKDMVFFLRRKDMQPYDTTIEGGVGVIESIVRWNVRNKITPQEAALKMVFGDGSLKVSQFRADDSSDKLILNKEVGQRTQDIRYPWIGPMIYFASDALGEYYGHDFGRAPANAVEARI